VIRRQFAAELRHMTPARRDDVVATIGVLTSVESWQQYRRSYGRSARQTRRAWVEAIERLLGDA